MIPEIGVMVGLYIITRMLATVIDKTTPGSVRIFGSLTLIVATLVMADLVVGGVATGRQFEQLLPR